MRITHLHSWNVTLSQAIKIQREFSLTAGVIVWDRTTGRGLAVPTSAPQLL